MLDPLLPPASPVDDELDALDDADVPGVGVLTSVTTTVCGGAVVPSDGVWTMTDVITLVVGSGAAAVTVLVVGATVGAVVVGVVVVGTAVVVGAVVVGSAVVVGAVVMGVDVVRGVVVVTGSDVAEAMVRIQLRKRRCRKRLTCRIQGRRHD